MTCRSLTAGLIALALAPIAQDAVALTVSTTFDGSVSTMSQTRQRGFFTETDWYTEMSAISFSVEQGTFSFGVEAVDGVFDPYIYLFEADNNFSQNDLIAFNDDINYPDVLDSYLSVNLAAGDYIAVVGQWMNWGGNGAGDIDYQTDVVDGNVYGGVANWNTLPENGTVLATYNYQIAMTGENLVVDGVPAVPLPASMPLLIGAFAVPMLMRRRKKSAQTLTHAALPA
ncbi:DVUA0089 family protein [Celeribacter marinus]|uniref:DVUA0089 family protein n=1 Tax=Celeribacter marinus TaxID=1397108 RepID=UPI00317A2C31